MDAAGLRTFGSLRSLRAGSGRTAEAVVSTWFVRGATQVSQMMPNAIPAVQNFEILSISHRKIKL